MGMLTGSARRTQCRSIRMAKPMFGCRSTGGRNSGYGCEHDEAAAENFMKPNTV
jgi:hypothetical protein